MEWYWILGISVVIGFVIGVMFANHNKDKAIKIDAAIDDAFDKAKDKIKNQKGFVALPESLERIIIPLIVFIAIVISLFYLKIGAGEQQTGLRLLLYKMALPNCGVVNAHIVRKLLFPEINFQKETEWGNNLMIVVLYAAFIYAYTIGG